MWFPVGEIHPMRKRIASAAVLITLLFVLTSRTVACSGAVGYFIQVTNLRGRVVGSSFPVLHSPVAWPAVTINRQLGLRTRDGLPEPAERHLTPVKTVTTGKDGRFDFGRVESGHYYLEIDDKAGALYDQFEVELKGASQPKASVTIDISPIRPDCTGGHELLINAN